MLGLYSLLSYHPVENLKCYLGMPLGLSASGKPI